MIENKITQLYKNKELILTDRKVIVSVNFIIFNIIQKYYNLKKDIFVVCPNLYEAQKMYDSIVDCTNQDDVLFFPQDELLTTLMALGSPEFLNERLHTLRSLIKNKKPYIVVTTMEGFLKKQLSLKDYNKAVKKIKINQNFKQEKLVELLINNGYQYSYIVEKPREYSIRGSIIDFYSPFDSNPIRVDFFGDVVDEIKVFDISTQRKIQNIESFELYPLNELFYNREILDESIIKINNYFDKLDLSEKEKNKKELDIEDLLNYNRLDKLAIYIPFFSDSNTSLIDFSKDKDIIIFDLEKSIINNKQKIDDKKAYTISFDGDSFLNIDFQMNFENHIKKANHIIDIRGEYSNVYNVVDIEYYNKDINRFIQNNKHILTNDTYTTIITASNETNYQIIREKLVLNNILFSTDVENNKVCLIVDKNTLSFNDLNNKIYLISDINLLSSKYKPQIKYRSVINQSTKIREISELEIDDYVVHYDYGIAKYKGLNTTDVSGVKRDYIQLEYKDLETLYIPVDKLDKILKYSSNDGRNIQLSKIGSKTWTNTKKSVIKKIKELSDRLLKLYSKRENAQGVAFKGNYNLEKELEQDFEYVETNDQKSAIKEVFQDMENTKPMDRLIIGDVGFGKTEVAIRAAFKTVLSGKQVAYLVPTTILARQHYLSFKQRMEKYGVNVEILTRHITRKKTTEVIKNLQMGLVDVLIGTHRIISKDIIFNDLGLFILDEEQRFGVIAKETIKEKTINVDVLSLSATPIPRTLQLSLSGLKDISLINTPPVNRYPVQTYVVKKDYDLIKEVIRREIARGGQVFYLYNYVETIEVAVRKLQELIPEAKITYAHGQMPKNQIEKTISEFIDHEYDILVSTTIIETGIDIPNTNTLIIEDSHKFGLAQLYQIRGRVGRSDRIAYCYLLYDDKKILTPESIKRLNTIENFTQLGSGFKVAMQDLNIRGSGDILGSEQSGFIDSVGIELYLKLLKQEVDNIQAFKENNDEGKVFSSQHIDKEYISDDKIRIEIHKLINNIDSISKLEDLKDELTDRFGKINVDIILYMYNKLYNKLSYNLGVINTEVLLNKIIITISLEKSEIDGIRLFNVANSFYIPTRLSNPGNNINIELDISKEKRHWLYIACQFFDKYYNN